MTIEQTILGSLISNEEYVRKVLPYLKEEYFQDPSQSSLFGYIQTYIDTYNTLPSIHALTLCLEADNKNFNKKEAEKVLNSFDGEIHNTKWLMDITEEFCKQQAIYNAIHESLNNLKDETGKKQKSAIPGLLEEAIATSFDSHIGHDYMEDAEARWDFYHENKKRVPTDIDLINQITKGGFPTKTLTILAGAVGFGKTAMMCHFAAHNLTYGKNVLYITLEMAEELIAERIDANLLDVSLDELRTIPESVFEARMERLRKKNPGKLIIHEYAPGSAGAGNFRHLLHELKIKKNFIPDILYIDYLSIAASSRVRRSSVSTKDYLQFVAEEVRAISVDYDVPLISAVQINRAGFEDSDPGMQHTADSWGLPATADFMWIIIVNDELLSENKVLVKQAKNRYGDPNNPRKFVIGRDLSKMRLFNCSSQDQEHADHTNEVKDKADIEVAKLKAKFADFT